MSLFKSLNMQIRIAQMFHAKLFPAPVLPFTL